MSGAELLSHWPAAHWRARKLLVGVSGGADSVALLLALHELAEPGQLLVAHFNHGWRGKESDADQQFVQQLCQRLHRPALFATAHTSITTADTTNLPHHTPPPQPAKPPAAPATPQLSPTPLPTRHAHVNQNDNVNQIDLSDQVDDNWCRDAAMQAKEMFNASESRDDALELGLGHKLDADSSKDSSLLSKTEENARQQRYEFFKQCAYAHGVSYVVTAHTADDRIETVLHNLFRGSGLHGAASLRMFRPMDQDLVLVRPLLSKWRTDVLRYLGDRQQTFREDSSNTNTKFSRNFLRHQLMPLVRERYPQMASSLLSFSELTEETLEDLQFLAQNWLVQVAAWREQAQRGTGAGLDWHAWPEERYWVLPRAAAEGYPWTVIRQALRSVWLARQWPQADLTRAHWQSLRELLLDRPLAPATPTTPATLERRVLLTLPGGLKVESQGQYLAVGR